MYKFIISIFVLLIYFDGKSQELKMSGSLVGFGTAGIANGRKLVATRFFDIGYENFIDHFWRWRVGIGYVDVQFDGTITGLEYYRRKKFITLPLALRKYSTISKRSEVYVEIGVYNKYEMKDEVDYNNLNVPDVRYSRGGYSLDMLGFGGFKTQLGKITMIDLGVGGTKYLFADYKLKQNKIRVKASYLTLNLSRKLGR